MFYRRPPISQNPNDIEPNKPGVPDFLWKFAFIGILILSVIIYFRSNDVPTPAPGVLVAEDPEIVFIDDGQSFQSGDYTFKPLATLNITARVLHTKNYYKDRSAELSPVDFALGWGEMSDSAILKYLDISQSSRWYTWGYHQKPPVSNDYISSHSRNVHIIPANHNVANIVKKVKQNNIIKMSGYLVQITGKDGFTWSSYLYLTGEGNHTCLVLLVEDISILP